MADKPSSGGDRPQPHPQLIVGLGNPGPKYAGTRHNVGFDSLDALSRSWAIPLKQERRFQGEYGAGVVAGTKVYLLKPQTYMNRSGQSIRAVVDWLKLDPATVLVVYDDMDLPIGRLRLRLGGSAGGHNGMKSAISHLGTQAFPRVRIGIGAANKAQGRDQAVVSHVLGSFSPSERRIMTAMVDEVGNAVDLAVRRGVDLAMNRYNGLDLAAELQV